MTNALSVLGSTGSIGVQALEVCENLNIRVAALAAGSNIDLLEKQIRRFKPALAAVFDENGAKALRERVADLPTEIVGGQAGLLKAAQMEEADSVLSALVGIAGLLPTMKAIKAGKQLALANKETLVTAGSLVMDAAKEAGTEILPVDSEHAAIFQCLAGNRAKDVDSILLTASGGPFRGFTAEQLKTVTLEQALKHPNWSMGSKITIDSATMMNKGLEVIEAMWLFEVEAANIEVVIHKESIIHSMVSYRDGSILAQLGAPDMRVPIQLALTWPERRSNPFKRLSFKDTRSLTFEEPDLTTFRCLALAYEAAGIKGTMPAAMNAANEIAVAGFLKKELAFHQIPELIEKVMLSHSVNSKPVLDDIIDTDRTAREKALAELRRI